MTTKQLAIYLIIFIAVVAVLFGLVPPMLNRADTFTNAIGIAVVLATVLAAVLTAHATYTHDHPKKLKKHERNDK
jgi:uncharacterized membrane protein